MCDELEIDRIIAQLLTEGRKFYHTLTKTGFDPKEAIAIVEEIEYRRTH